MNVNNQLTICFNGKITYFIITLDRNIDVSQPVNIKYFKDGNIVKEEFKQVIHFTSINWFTTTDQTLDFCENNRNKLLFNYCINRLTNNPKYGSIDVDKIIITFEENINCKASVDICYAKNI